MEERFQLDQMRHRLKETPGDGRHPSPTPDQPRLSSSCLWCVCSSGFFLSHLYRSCPIIPVWRQRGTQAGKRVGTRAAKKDTAGGRNPACGTRTTNSCT